MKRKRTGYYLPISTVGNEKCLAFVPDPLPPKPPLQIDPGLQAIIDDALVSLGRLDSTASMLPDSSLLLYMYIRKEAVLSSQIEGTQSSLSDLLLFESNEIPGVPLDDVQEVSNYVAAMNHGLERIKSGFPISLRLLREIHKILLSKGRGSGKEPGEFRRSQNWIGGTRPGNASFIPPPPDKVKDCLGDLENYIHDKPIKTPILVKAALSHVQFETIHPFLDGNGRLGRLLIALLLCSERLLSEPLLYLSVYFKTHRQIYYDLLNRVRIDGDWESWLRFFMDGVKETSENTIKMTKTLAALLDRDREIIKSIGKSSASVLKVHTVLQKKPVASINLISKSSELSIPTVTSALKKLQSLGIVREITNHRRGRLFSYEKYIQLLNEGE